MSHLTRITLSQFTTDIYKFLPTKSLTTRTSFSRLMVGKNSGKIQNNRNQIKIFNTMFDSKSFITQKNMALNSLPIWLQIFSDKCPGILKILLHSEVVVCKCSSK